MNKKDEIYKRVLDDYEKLSRKYGFVLVQGKFSLELEELIGFNINFEIAKNLQIPTIELINAKDINNLDKIKEYIDYLINLSKRSTIRLFGVVINRVNPKLLNSLKSIQRAIPIFVIPEIKEFASPTVLDFLKQSKANLVSSESIVLDRSVYNLKIATMQLQNYIDDLEDGDLIVVSKDRIDIIMGTLIINYSKNYPSISGIILVGKMAMPSNIKKIVKSINILEIPILSLNLNIQTSIDILSRVSPKITLENRRKLALAEGIFTKYVSISLIKKYLILEKSNIMTPIRFKYYLYNTARGSNKNILLTDSNDERVLRAVDIILRRDICNITLLGDIESIEQKSSALGLDLSKAKVIDPNSNLYTEQFVNKLYELRRDKGMVRAIAKDLIAKPNYFATMMVYFGYVDGVVSGINHTTRETIKPALEIIKTADSFSLVSSIFFILQNDRVLIYGDCALNIDPTADELAQIAISSVRTAKEFGIEPIVAILSYSSSCSTLRKDNEKVREATRTVQAIAPDIPIEGPIQYDSAIDKGVLKHKIPSSKVAKKATIFIFPDLNIGNNTYKSFQRGAKTAIIGPIFQGLKRPFNDLNRNSSIEDIINTIAITAIQAKNLDL
jgi:phosphate acetyltransferase